MSTRPKNSRFQQLEFFRSRPKAPRRPDLSLEVRGKVLPLLARLLRAARRARLTPDRGREASDE